MTKSKPWRRFLPILLAVLLALGIALYAVPYAQMVSYRNSAPVQTCAAQLAAAYTGKKIVIASHFFDSDYWEDDAFTLDLSADTSGLHLHILLETVHQ